MHEPVVSSEIVSLIKRATLRGVKIRNESYDTTTERCSISYEEASVQACAEFGIHHSLAPLLWLAMSEWVDDLVDWCDGGFDALFDADGKLIPQGPYFANGAKICILSSEV